MAPAAFRLADNSRVSLCLLRRGLCGCGIRRQFAGAPANEIELLLRRAAWRSLDQLAGFGGQLDDLHARNQADGSAIGYRVNGDNVIEEVRYEPPLTTGKDRHAGRVWINDKQYFEGVAPEAWSFPIGGYLPAQRWLKDRKGRTLSYEEKEAYPRIVVALSETGRLMREIDAAIAKHGGWPKAFV